ncbi:MAG: hypothetical protein H6708_33000 [Kofleriaceae bacterium]|nr:hypothetical protein [Kofleriaceae bacterium]
MPIAAAALVFWLREPWVVAVPVPALAVSFVVASVVTRLRWRRRAAWVRHLPFPIDRDSLAARLEAKPAHDRLRVTVTFATDVAADARETVARAATGAWGEVTARWQGPDLVVETGPIDCRIRRYSSDGTERRPDFAPRPYLRACQQLVVDCLGTLHRVAAPIAQVRFEDTASPRRRW